MARPTKLQTNKKAVLRSLETSYGNISTACRKVEVGRSTFYEWYNADPEFAEAADKAIETGAAIRLDMAEEVIEDDLSNKDSGTRVNTAKWLLEHKGKARGYVKKQEIEAQVTKIKPPKIVFNDSNAQEGDDTK